MDTTSGRCLAGARRHRLRCGAVEHGERHHEEATQRSMPPFLACSQQASKQELREAKPGLKMRRIFFENY
jgi:hypothetical protein